MSVIIFLIGLLAQFFYTARVLVQWIKSERARRVVSPTLFWIFSIAGSMLLFLYGYLRQDFSIIFGEFLSYYIYMWNLHSKGVYRKINLRVSQHDEADAPLSLDYAKHQFTRWGNQLGTLVMLAQASLPVIVIAGFIADRQDFMASFIYKSDLPLIAILWGSTGQFIYKMRFVYQWWYSHRHGESLLPRLFWWMAVIGSLIIISYGIYRRDWILILGQIGIVASIRNLILGRRESTAE